MKKLAFTILELIVVIMIISILSALALPRLDRDAKQEAADTILSAIRYTQHLALLDNKTNPSDGQWQKTLWHIRFSRYSGTKWFYTISSNMDHNANVDKKEAAIDPSNGKYIYNLGGDDTIDTDESPNIFLSKKFGISSISFNGGCSSQHIAFDHLGRPFAGIYSATNNFAKYMHSNCIITFGFIDNSEFKIIIEKETGYAYIMGQINS